MKPMSMTLRVLARLLSYPDAKLREHLGSMREVLHRESVLGSARLAELDALIERLASKPAMDIEAHYVEMFDRGRGTALHLFEHVHGDSRDRGQAMVDLVKTYEQAGLHMQPGELPDHLTVVLEYASTQPAAQAREFLSETAHILQAIYSALGERRSPYRSALAAVLDLAGVKAKAIDLAAEPPLDESWEEPPAFGGCSHQGQARPDQSQPIQILKRPPADRTATPSHPGARP